MRGKYITIKKNEERTPNSPWGISLPFPLNTLNKPKTKE
jgi:hypothetical protein